MADPAGENNSPIVIKKIVKGGGHHGGAWKVAYADFVTAMMAFFLLLWLLNVVTDEQKNAISNYFDPTHPAVSENTSGAGGVLGGLTMSPKGAMASTKNPLTPTNINKQRPSNSPKKTAKQKAREKAEKKRFKDAEQKLKQAIQKSPELRKLAQNIKIDMTPEGLRIQIIDQEGEPMFPSGSARMFPKTKHLLEKITEIIKEMPNQISIRGHTDSSKYAPGATYTNWELSADRANASRRVLLDSGLPADRINDVMGKADTDPLIPDNPKAPQNRRLTLILLKEELTNPNFYDEDQSEEENSEEDEEEKNNFHPPTHPIGTFRKTPGAVEFP